VFSDSAQEARAANILAAAQALEIRVAQLAPEWDDWVHEYERAAAAHDAAQRTLREAERLYADASEQHLRAAQVAEVAASEWKLAQALIVVAAAMDAARLDAVRSGRELGELSCVDGMSPRAYRTHLAEAGVSLTGKDVCHIVPLSLGGANHPLNYIRCDASLNRSLGNAFSRAICDGYAGADRCARHRRVAQVRNAAWSRFLRGRPIRGA
jgi:hypothetical protein